MSSVEKKFKIEWVATEDLSKASWNYKTDSQEMRAKLTENIKRNGILQPSIIYDDNGSLVVLDGNHRLDCYNEIGIKKVPCINLGGISLPQAKRIAIEVNETKFDSDVVKLSEALQDIKVEFELEDMEVTMPYSQEELKGMIDLLDSDWEDETGGLKDVNFKARIKIVKCPECGNEFES